MAVKPQRDMGYFLPIASLCTHTASHTYSTTGISMPSFAYAMRAITHRALILPTCSRGQFPTTKETV